MKDEGGFWTLAPDPWPLVCSVIVLLAGSCDSGGPGRAGRQRRETVRIVVVAESRDDPAWGALQAAGKRFAARRRFVEVEVNGAATRSPREQRALLESPTMHAADAVCIVPMDATAIRSAIDQLVQKGTPVVTIGRDVPTSLRVAYCGPYEVDIGRSAARACAAAVRERSKTVMLLHGGRDDPVYGPRYRGFMEELRLHPELLLTHELDCKQNRSDALRLVRQQSRKYPRAGCWVLLEDWPLRALKGSERLLSSDTAVVMCNGSRRHWDRVREGWIEALVTYDFGQAVEQGLLASLQLGRREEVVVVLTPHYTCDVEIITAEILEHAEVRWRAWTEGQDGD